MKPLYYLIFISTSLLLSLTSCDAGGSIFNLEGKIIGTWEFDKVEFKTNGKSGYADYSFGYQGCTITFREGGILEAYDKDLDTTASGYWIIDYYEEFDENDNIDQIFYLQGTLDIPELGIYEDLFWDELRVSTNRLKAIEEGKDNGKYRYRLLRQ